MPKSKKLNPTIPHFLAAVAVICGLIIIGAARISWARAVQAGAFIDNQSPVAVNDDQPSLLP